MVENDIFCFLLDITFRLMFVNYMSVLSVLCCCDCYCS